MSNGLSNDDKNRLIFIPYNNLEKSPDVTSAGWVGLRPEYGNSDKGEYNVDDVLKTFLTKIFKIKGILPIE